MGREGIHPGSFWKECADACEQRSYETLFVQRAKSSGRAGRAKMGRVGTHPGSFRMSGKQRSCGIRKMKECVVSRKQGDCKLALCGKRRVEKEKWRMRGAPQVFFVSANF
jgi:hypothetical protein